MTENNSVKDEIISFLKTLPDDITLEKIIYHLFVKQKILNALDDVEQGRTYSHEEVKALIKKKFQLKEELMDIEHILIECCKIRMLPTELIHRTIHEFNWFYQNLIFDKSKILENEYFKITDSDLREQIAHRDIPQDNDLTLRTVILLYYKYCKHIYADAHLDMNSS